VTSFLSLNDVVQFFRQAKLQADLAIPYDSPIDLESTLVTSNARKSESELPLTASFHTPGSQQWDNQGRAVGYASENLCAPQPQRLVKIPSQPLSSSSTPAMSERTDGRAQPTRTNTNGSSSSWNVQSNSGPNAYPMSHQPPYQNAPSSRMPTLPPPPNSATVPAPTSSYQQTPTQAEFPYPGDSAASATTSPRTTPAPNYPSQYQQATAYPPGSSPLVPAGQHHAQPTGSSYYSAYSGHSQQPTYATDDPYTAYRP
jgi:hypothetical protein